MKSSAMKSLAAVVAVSPLAAGLKTIANPAVQEIYTSGEVMDSIMSKKFVSLDRMFPSSPTSTSETPKSMALISFIY